MQEFRKDEIIYDEGFLNPSEEYIMEKSEEQEETALDPVKNPKETTAKSHGQVVISIQLIVCVLIALAVFLVKMFNVDTYASIKSWYDIQMNKTLISQSTFDENLLTDFLNSVIYNNSAEKNATSNEISSEKN